SLSPARAPRPTISRPSRRRPCRGRRRGSAPSPPRPCRRASLPLPPPRRRSSPGSRAASARRIRARSASPGTREFSRCFPPDFLTYVPFWIPLLDGLTGGLERMALIELERLWSILGVFRHLAGKGLDRRGRQAGEHLGKVRAALDAAERFPH